MMIDGILALVPVSGVHWVYLGFIFLMGISVGSFLNVCVARLPMEKSILWPGSRCFTCLRPIRKTDNLPIIGYLRLRGKCRTCGTRFSSRYLWVELFTGISFVAIFYFDVIANWHESSYFSRLPGIEWGRIPWQGWIYFLHHATLFSFLLVAALTDLDGKIIPLSVTLPGTLIGLTLSAFLGWPFPEDLSFFPKQMEYLKSHDWYFSEAVGLIPRGLYPWPVWGPLPDWIGYDTVQGRFLTGFCGAVVGTMMTRIIKFLFEKGLGRQALGLGDADLMMLAGAFLGWQLVVVGFFVGVFANLFFAIILVIVAGDRYSPLGPGLAVGFLITLYSWKWMAPELQPYFFDPIIILFAISFMVVGIIVGSFFLRALPAPESPIRSS